MSHENKISRRQFLEASAGSLLASKSLAQERIVINPRDYVMTPEAAVDYAAKEISPILLKIMRDQKEIPALRNRLTNLFTRQKNGQIDHQAMPAYHPKTKGTTAKIDWDPIKKRPILFVFIPAMQNYKRDLDWGGYKLADRDFLIGNIYAHEEIHLEHNDTKYPLAQWVNKSNPALTAKEEAETWGKMLLEIIKPGISRGHKVPKNFTDSLKRLESLKSDYTSQKWVDIFKTYNDYELSSK